MWLCAPMVPRHLPCSPLIRHCHPVCLTRLARPFMQNKPPRLIGGNCPVNTYYLTTAIAYPNGEPHIGHAYEYIATDVMARFKRLDGYDVRYLTGTDEHGQKMQQTAIQEGIEPMELATRNANMFQRMDDEVLGISYDRFIRTTDDDHYASSREIWRRMEANGDIYLDT